MESSHRRWTIVAVGILALAIALSASGAGGTYGEHKRIGDAAFRQVMRARTSDPLLRSALSPVLHLDVSGPTQVTPAFVTLRAENGDSVDVTYGDLNALSGDHVESPLVLYEQINDEFSRLKGIVLKQHAYLARYATGTPDVENALDDLSALGMVITDMSHFYDLQKDFVQHVGDFDPTILDTLLTFRSERTYTRELYAVPLINKYVILHSLALCAAQEACRHNSPRTLLLALYINAYADHFIQDAFASGHRVVHRTLLGSFTNSKFVHDLFGAGGLRSINTRGRTWLSYGDGCYNKRLWRGFDGADQTLSENMQIAMQACSASVSEVFDVFQGGGSFRGQSIRDALDALTGSDDSKYEFFMRRYEALSLIPIPFGRTGDRTAAQEEIRLGLDRNAPRFQAMSTVKRDSAVDAEARSRLGGLRTLRDLDARPEKTGPQHLVKAANDHLGIGLLFIASQFGGGHDSPGFADRTIGYGVSLKGLLNDFSYDNETYNHRGGYDWWMDLSVTNLFVKHGDLSGTEFKLGITQSIDVYHQNTLALEVGVVNEFGWYHMGETIFRWEPSAELGLWPHDTGLKLRVRLMRTPDHHRLDLGLVLDVPVAVMGITGL